MGKFLIAAVIILSALFFYHQYEYAGPYSAVLRNEAVSADTVLKNIKRWRYHDYVWFEFVPDALTTAFKRIGIGGWSETGHRICVEGCPYWTEYWTDGFYTVDLEIEKLSVDSKVEQTFTEPGFMDVEIWGDIRAKLKKRGELPQVGNKARICGLLRVDRPYHVYTIHPDSADDIHNLGKCQILPKRDPDTIDLVQKLSCQQLGQLSLSDQIAIIDALTDREQSTLLADAIEKMIGCVQPAVLNALASDADVYAKLISLTPTSKLALPPLDNNVKRRESEPVMNTIRDLLVR